MKIEFHSHSKCSDGLLSAEEMINRAISKGLDYYALTDHDTISGLDICKRLSKNSNLTFIPGLELSTTYNNESIHILGFFRDSSYNNKEFIDFLDIIKNQRKLRAEKITQKLKSEFDITISFERVLSRGEEVVGRPHIAEEIISEGYNFTLEEIFSELIGNDCRAYVPTTKLSTEEGISMLKKYNALVFLAHPILIKKSPLSDFIKMNFDGIEAIYYQNTKKQEEYLLNISKENNLLISAGSDFHGNITDNHRHGDIGSMSSYYKKEYLNDFLKAFKKSNT